MNLNSSTGIRISLATLALFLLASLADSQRPGVGANAEPPKKALPLTLALDSLDGLEIQAVHEHGLDPARVQADVAVYQGRHALHLLNDDTAIVKGDASGGQSLAIVKASDFKDGTIEVELVGLPRVGSPPDTRGFVGIAFHVQDHGSRFEAFYLRFTNGRADDQLRRNHAVQYVSEPDFPWFKLRREAPGVYESYADIEPGAWTKIKVVVDGAKARLYVNGTGQPCLIVNDLKLGAIRGQVALWNGADTEAYFSSLRIE